MPTFQKANSSEIYIFHFIVAGVLFRNEIEVQSDAVRVIRT